MRTARTYSFLLAMVAIGSGAGLLYGILTDAPIPSVGMIYGGSIALLISSFDRGLLFHGLRLHVRQWPTWLYIPAMEAVSVALTALGFLVAGTITWNTGLVSGSYIDAIVPSLRALMYSLLIAAILVFIMRMRDLMGHEVFNNLLLGRYHKPVEERRIFLFLDVIGSTRFARTHGDLQAQRYLGAIFAMIAEPVIEHGGAIDDYIGDMAMITWPERRGLSDARCLRCIVAILAAIEAQRTDWLRRFGQVPEFQAALHGGSVVTAEIGVDRHKISYFGDVVNTTARIEQLCRQLGARLLISADLLARMPVLPDGIRAFSRGDHAVKGLDQRLGVFSLDIGGTATTRPRLTVAAHPLLENSNDRPVGAEYAP